VHKRSDAEVSGKERERRHAPGDGRLWEEAWGFEFADGEGLGGYVRLALLPNQGRSWYWFALVRPGLPGPIHVRDHDVPIPRAGLEIRSEGLWAELICETPMEHWSIGLEAFAVALDTPDAALDPRGEIGDRIAVGLDLEWEVDGEARLHAVGDDRIAFDGRGVRAHEWGERDWWAAASSTSPPPAADVVAAAPLRLVDEGSGRVAHLHRALERTPDGYRWVNAVEVQP
jgi:hypothetical protein